MRHSNLTKPCWIIMCDFREAVSEMIPIGSIGKRKDFPYSLPSVGPGADPGVQAVSPLVTVSHPPSGRLPLLSARPAVTFPAAQHHCPLAGTKLYCMVTEAHRCEQLARGCYAAYATSRIWTHDLFIISPTLYPLRHRATSGLVLRGRLNNTHTRTPF